MQTERQTLKYGYTWRTDLSMGNNWLNLDKNASYLALNTSCELWRQYLVNRIQSNCVKVWGKTILLSNQFKLNSPKATEKFNLQELLNTLCWNLNYYKCARVKRTDLKVG